MSANGLFAPDPIADAAANVPREVACRLNPLIGQSHIEDTLDAVAAVVYEMGFLVTSTDLKIDSLFHVFNLASKALDWERSNIRSMKEIDHG